MNITDAFVEALKQAAEKHGNVNQISKLSGVGHPSLYRYLSGKSKRICKRHYDKLLPYISEYLKPKPVASDGLYDVNELSPEAIRIATLFDRLDPEHRQQIKRESERISYDYLSSSKPKG